MKKRFLALSLIILTLAGITWAAELQQFTFPFTGRWQPSEDPTILDDYGLQDIQNLRKVGKHFKGISGHTKINTSAITTETYLLNGFHFRKDQPSESHVLVVSANSTTPTSSKLKDNQTAIPSAGNFSTSVLHTDITGGIGTGRFSYAPAGNMVYATGAETLIWGGNEIEATAFITSAGSLSGTSSTLTNPSDFSERVINTRQTADQVALVGGGIDTYTKLLLHGDGADGSTTITDSSSFAHVVTAAGSAAVDTAQLKFGTGSILLDGSGDYVTSADSVAWFMDTGKFTIDFWVRFNTIPAATIPFYSQYADANNYIAFYHSAAAAPTELMFQIQTGGGAVEFTLGGSSTSEWNPVVNTWYHLALIRGWGGNSSSWAITVNGTALVTGTYAGSYADIAAALEIGKVDTLYHDGWIDEFRISKGIARWTSNFTVPTRAYRTASNTFLVGSTRPIQGVKLYVADANTDTATMTAQEWNGVSWTNLTITDNTNALATTGTVTFSSTASTSKVKYINGLSLYWYQFTISSGSATVYYCTVDAPMQTIKNIWNGEKSYPVKFLKWNGTTYNDYTDNVVDSSTSTYADLSNLATGTNWVVAGFSEPQQGIEWTFVAGKENATAATTMTGYYWDSSAWVALQALTDGTAASTTSMSKTGVSSWQSPGTDIEFGTAISDEFPLYYYKITFAGNLDAEVHVAEVRGIGSPPSMSTYTFSETYQNRLFLFNEASGEKNSAIYSQTNSPDIFNGSDSGRLYFGDRTELTAAARLYNIFRNTAADQLIVTKRNETYRVSGDAPASWVVQRMSANIGCVAPLSMTVCDTSDGTEADTKRQVVIWQSDKGFVMTDGAAIVPISDDIRCYFDPNDSRYIPTSRQSKTVGWYDPSTQSYKALISSGSGQAYHNVELEYSLKYKEWTKIYRTYASAADPLQSGFQVFDTNGVGYTYGGTKTGLLYRLENGYSFDGTKIAQILWTKDMVLDSQLPLMRKTTIKNMRTAMKKKTNGDTITITHYGDQTATSAGPTDINTATSPYNTQTLNAGPYLYHSLKFSYSAPITVSGGMELTGVGFYVEPYTAIR